MGPRQIRDYIDFLFDNPPWCRDCIYYLKAKDKRSKDKCKATRSSGAKIISMIEYCGHYKNNRYQDG